MLVPLLAHADELLRPHDLWTAWNIEPTLVVSVSVLIAVYWRGRLRSTSGDRDRRPWAFAGAIVTIAVALVSPLDAVSGSLASAHMVQHVLLILVAAPLLALSAPLAPLLRGTPRSLLRAATRRRMRLGLTARRFRALQNPVAAWVLHVSALWFWHAAVPYQAALESQLVHVVQHVTFFLTAFLFWHAVLDTRHGVGAWSGVGILLVFAMALQSVVLSALLIFSTTPWYPLYATTTQPWSLTPLADQQLAGAIMSVPGGLLYVGVGLTMVVSWIRASEGHDDSFRKKATSREASNTYRCCGI